MRSKFNYYYSIKSSPLFYSFLIEMLVRAFLALLIYVCISSASAIQEALIMADLTLTNTLTIDLYNNLSPWVKDSYNDALISRRQSVLSHPSMVALCEGKIKH